MNRVVFLVAFLVDYREKGRLQPHAALRQRPERHACSDFEHMRRAVLFDGREPSVLVDESFDI